MKAKIVSGASLAIAAVALAVNGVAPSPALAKKAASPVHCAGINSCKGMSSCKTEKSSCKGLNSCKGQGWLPEKSAKACEAKGGTVAEM
ncbi:MAG: BufA2 family periplasmic bufferin-type metallophore [Methylocystis sp.]|uniref:BufA2 family periplasmic bufferin-type metallophore n=1 Tax=Methylocystis sp. TaxID=1911079 RepID=UPI003DA5B8F3